MSLFGKSPAGGDAINIGGHEVPVSMLAVGATALGLIVVLRARGSRSNVVATGPAAPTSAYSPSDATQSGLADQLNVLSNEIGQILAGQQQGIPPAPAPPTQANPPSTIPATVPADLAALGTSIFLAELGRPPDPNGLGNLVHQIQVQGPAAIATYVQNSPEGQAFSTNKLYTTYLGRPNTSPDAIAYWGNKVAQLGYQATAAEIASQPEALAYAAAHNPPVTPH